jgi:hypothetical protein
MAMIPKIEKILYATDLSQNSAFGSTAKRVLRRTRKPVFIIPLPGGETDITFHDD